MAERSDVSKAEDINGDRDRPLDARVDRASGGATLPIMPHARRDTCRTPAGTVMMLLVGPKVFSVSTASAF
jgi:hypothetical protein